MCALKYAKEGCNCRVRLVFMALSLPNALGGMGLWTLRFNRRFVFMTRTHGGGGSVERFADFALRSIVWDRKINSLTIMPVPKHR